MTDTRIINDDKAMFTKPRVIHLIPMRVALIDLLA